MYLTNLFRSLPQGLYHKFKCFSSELMVTEQVFWASHRSLNLPQPYTTHGNRIYFSSGTMKSNSHFKSIASIDIESESLSIDEDPAAIVIRNLTYSSIHDMLSGAGFSSIRTGPSRLFYIDNNPMYVLKLDMREASYFVYRGLCPGIVSRMDIGSLDIRFAPERMFRIEVPLKAWNEWIGYPVKLRGNCGLSVDYAGRFELVEADVATGLVRVNQAGANYELNGNSVYVPASSDTLRRRSKYIQMNQFSRFQESKSQSLIDLMMGFLAKFTKDGKFRIPYGEDKATEVEFSQVTE